MPTAADICSVHDEASHHSIFFSKKKQASDLRINNLHFFDNSIILSNLHFENPQLNLSQSKRASTKNNIKNGQMHKIQVLHEREIPGMHRGICYPKARSVFDSVWWSSGKCTRESSFGFETKSECSKPYPTKDCECETCNVPSDVRYRCG